jgi:excisionase family DNA binding protein
MGTPKVMPTADAARRLQVTPRTVRRWLASGRLTGQRIGCILVVDDAAVDAELERARRDGRA